MLLFGRKFNTLIFKAPEIELNVTVLTSNCWPMSHSPSLCTLPRLMSKACQSFEQFYLSRHSGRRLTWQLHLGNADVRVRFKSRSHDLNVSTYALVILLLFENVEEDGFLTYEVHRYHFLITRQFFNSQVFLRKSKKVQR